MRIIIAEDEKLLRDLIKVRLKEAWPKAQFGEAETTAQAIQLLAKSTCDILLLDITLKGRNAFEVLDYIRDMNDPPPVLIVTSHSEKEFAVRCLAAGAKGFITKDAGADELIHAINIVKSGEAYITRSATQLLADHTACKGRKLDFRAPHHRLSNREMEVLIRLGAGQSVNQIAKELALSIKTIFTHRAHILEKLGVATNAELIVYAIENRLV